MVQFVYSIHQIDNEIRQYGFFLLVCFQNYSFEESKRQIKQHIPQAQKAPPLMQSLGSLRDTDSSVTEVICTKVTRDRGPCGQPEASVLNYQCCAKC